MRGFLSGREWYAMSGYKDVRIENSDDDVRGTCA
jgi:hypothetical protein